MSDDAACDPSLANLDQRRIAVHIHMRGCEQLVIGTGEYHVDPELGAVLRIQSQERSDHAELLFVESQWTGEIGRGHALGCDYLIRLG